MLLCLLLFLDQGLFLRFSGGQSEGTAIGTVFSMSHDVRFKGDHNFDWNPAKSGQVVSGGDAIYSGVGSKAIVTLEDGSKVEVGEKSLVRFVKKSGDSMTDLSLDNFKVQVDGEAKVTIDGEETTLTGNGDFVDVAPVVKKIEERRRKLGIPKKVVKKTPKPRSFFSIPMPASEPEPEPVKIAKPVVEKPVVVAKAESPPTPAPTAVPTPEKPKGPPVAMAEASSTFYTWKLYDLFERKEAGLTRREHVPMWLKAQRKLKWSDFSAATYKVEHSSDPTFASAVRNYDSQEQSVELTEVYKGTNYWRVSRDGKEWSTASTFTVDAGLSPYVATFDQPNAKMTLDGAAVDYDIKWKAPEKVVAAGYVVEASTSPQFSQDTTVASWSTKNEIHAHTTTPQTLYYRVLTVLKTQEISAPSQPFELNVEAPSLLASPILPMAKMDLKKGENDSLTWKGPGKAKDYEVEVIDAQGRKVASKQTRNEGISVRGLKNGQYRYRVTAIDSMGRKGESSGYKHFGLGDKPAPAPAIVAAQPTPEPSPVPTPEEKVAKKERLPSSIFGENTGKVDPISPTTNTRYSDSAVQVEAAEFTMLSSKNKATDEQPSVASLAIRGWKWWGSFGTEGYFKSKLAGVNSTGNNVSPVDLEVRAHERLRLRWNWFDFLREIQLTAFVGAETYHSSTDGGKYSPGYNLAKVGSLISFPLGKRLSAGGEVIYGIGLDASTKWELSGNAFYYFEKNWALGGGYRAHFFTAGSTATSPSTVPYREGYLEAFSTLRYSY